MTDFQSKSPGTGAIIARIVVPLLCCVALICGLVGIVMMVRVGLAAGIAVMLCGIGALAASQILLLLKAIEADLSAIRAQLDGAELGELVDNLAAIRSQMGMGVFGLLGAPRKQTP